MFCSRRGLDTGDAGADIGGIPILTLSDPCEDLAVSVEDLPMSIEGTHDRPLCRLDPEDSVLYASPVIGSHLVAYCLQGILERVKTRVDATRNGLELRSCLSMDSFSTRFPNLFAGQFRVGFRFFTSPVQSGKDAHGGDEAPQRGPGGTHHRREFPWTHSDAPPLTPVSWLTV